METIIYLTLIILLNLNKLKINPTLDNLTKKVVVLFSSIK